VFFQLSSDGFFFSVSGTCFGSIGKQVLFPFVSVPVSIRNSPASFLFFDRDYKKKFRQKKIVRDSTALQGPQGDGRMTMCSLCMRQLGLLNNAQRRHNIGNTTNSGTTHRWTKQLLQVNLLQVVEPKVLQRSGRFRWTDSVDG